MLHDPEASFRTDLATQLSGAQTSLENRLTELKSRVTTGSDNVAIAQAMSHLQGLSELRERIERADPSALASLQSEVAAILAASQSLSNQSLPASQSQQAAQVALTQASEAARRSSEEFEDAYYKRHIFDQYLQFSSQHDEEEYRRREAERKQEIDKALAEHTPEGNLKANRLSLDQLKDAGAHGADRSPDYQRYMNELTSSKDNLEKQTTPQQPANAEKTKQASTEDLAGILKGAGVAVADEGAAPASAPRTAQPRVRT